ncbi:MAG: hypothetical protein NZM38_02360 [Cytophagales bacterium]|nr:hypothetical protein [Cytophagales bacterium]MDW8383596.1 hypothetical protein [Flammeovirgaceae bacterium]
MKLIGYYTLLALSLGFLVIGIHQIMVVGWAESYFLLMASILFLLIAQTQKNKTIASNPLKSAHSQTSNKKLRKK